MNEQQNVKTQVNQAAQSKKAWDRAYLRNGIYCLIVLLILALSAVPLAGCQGHSVQAETGTGSMAQAQAPPSETEDQVPDPKPDEILTILAVGDIMMHDTMLQAGWRSSTKDYDFASMFEQVAPILQRGDLVIGNLEVPLAGEAQKYSGYPMFNAPEILAKNLKDAGFDMVSTANNHCLDRRYSGLVSTLDHLDAVGLLHAGTCRNPEDQAKVTSMTVKGLKIALISGTYGTNGVVLPEGKGYAVNHLDQDLLLEQIAAAKKEGAQYIIAMLHWGQEYQPTPNEAQKTLANALFAGGADLILGSHPHVLQLGETVKESVDVTVTMPAASVKEDPMQGKQTKFVMYSLGNFISSQKGLERLSSLILNITLKVDGTTGAPSFEGASYIPLYTQKKDRNGRYHFVVWPIELALDAAKKPNNPFSAEDAAALKKAWEHVKVSQPSMVWEPVNALLSEDLPSQ